VKSVASTIDIDLAPLTAAELAATSEINIDTVHADTTVISPVPDNAEPVDRAIARLTRRTPQAIWKYRNPNGGLLFAVGRWEVGIGKKEFLPLSWVRHGDGAEGWAFKSHPAPRPLYGLERLANDPDASVVVVEGEKCSEAARAVFPKSVVITSPGGSNGFQKTDWSPLAGRSRVLIWGDADEAGEKYATGVAERLHDLGIEVLIVDVEKLASITAAGTPRIPIKGWDVANALAEGWPPELLRRTVHELATRSFGRPKFLSFGNFRMDSHGLSVTILKGKKEITLELAGPFEILGRVRAPNGEGWARWLRWCDDDGGVHTQSISDAELHGDPGALCATLASRGLKISTGLTRSHLFRYLNDASIDSRVTVVSKTGWHQIGDAKVFVQPDETIGSVKGETVIVQGAAAAPFEKRGSLGEWQNGVGSLVAGHARGVFAVSVAFTGPLLGLLGLEGGGFHFYGQSSRGKSTLVEATASVWGKGAIPGFVRPWRTTANALEGAAAIHSDTLLVLDELGMIDPREAAAAAYQLAAGSGKGRSGRDGSLRTSMSWRTMVISTGEICLSDKLVEGRQKARAGQQVRLIDISADAGAGFGIFDQAGASGDAQLLADSIKKAARSYYGSAGPQLVRHVLADDIDATAVVQMVGAFRLKYAPQMADGQVLRVCDRFGLVAAAGELARAFGIVPWEESEAIAAAGRCFKDWLDCRGGWEAGEVHASISQVRLFIEQHGDARFADLDDPGRTVPNRAGWRRGAGEGREWLIPPETWKAEVCAGFDSRMVARTLASRNMLERASDGFLSVRKIDGRSKRVYVVKPAIISEEGYE
jgi:putative DNA primase/helicase